ncbi:MAG: hypothetical protein ACJ74T_19600 [Pyrinomonadaceae bacterium]
MITLQLYKNGLYLTQSGFADPDNARVGFLLASPPAQPPPSIQLTSAAWNNGEADVLGYFAFFVPLSTLPENTRNWDTFGTALLNLFQSQPNQNQFGWINESPGNAPTLNGTQILVSRGSGVTAQNSFTLTFLNVSLEVSFSPFNQPTISFDEGQNAFLFDNSGQIVSLAAQPPGGSGQQTYPSTSPSLTLPLDGAQAGAAGAAFQFDANGLAQLEAGMLYVAPPSTVGGNLTSLKYQVLRLPGTNQQQLSFDAWFDVLGPLDGTRTFFQFSDQQVSSYFADTSGNTFALTTTSSGAPTDISRLVFANRVFQATTDQSFYYLTPAGTFQLSIDGVPTPVLPGGYARMLCGTTGTEFLQATVTGPTLDTVTFVPNQAAYAPPSAPQETADADSSPSFLSNVGGNVTTSWVQFSTTSGNYISQPEQSPLFQQGKNSQTTSLEGAPSDFQVYVLDFLPLPTWAPPPPPPPVEGLEAGAAAPTSAPAVPLVPYVGINSTNDPNFDVGPFINMESKALNPTRKNNFSDATLKQTKATPQASAPPPAPGDPDSLAMTPQGLLAGLEGTPPAPQVWVTTEIAQSPSGVLQITGMQEEIRQTLQQNLIFAVISTTQGGSTGTLFDFEGNDQTIDIADWFFSLSPDGTPSSDKVPVPPILILKFYDNMSIADLVGNVNLWSKADTFNDAKSFSAVQAQGYLQGVIQQACEFVYGTGNCPDGVPSGQPNTSSLYYDFYQKVTDPQFSGIIAVNCNIQLNNLPPAIKGVLGGMTTVNEQGERVSNIAAFRAHHVGVQINNTKPSSGQPTLEQSALFGLVDYEKPAASSKENSAPEGVETFYSYEVEYLRALFENAELRQFACKINLTINNLFTTDVTLDTGNTKGPMLLAAGEGGGGDANVVVITGSYQAHSTSDDDKSSGQGMYSFVAEGNFVFNFAQDNPYLDNITLTKLQFSFQQETPTNNPNTSTLTSRFAIWGSMVFKKFNDPDIFSFKQLTFADLGIGVTFDLTIIPALPPPAPAPPPPVTSIPTLTFSPGDLRLDIEQSQPRDDSDSMLKLLPFKLKSFLYSETADQTLESLNYYTLDSVEGLGGVSPTFNYALIFDLDLGSMGALVGSLAAFKFSVIIGWLSGTEGGICFGIQLPQADGKLEIKIQGVLTLSIALFQLKYVDYTPKGGTPQKLLVVVLHNSYMEVLGVRMPPGTGLIDFALFVPSDNPDKLGWLAAYNDGKSGVGGDGGGGGAESLRLAEGAAGAWEYIGSEESPEVRPAGLLEDEGGAGGNGNGNNGNDKPVFELVYLGGGQRVGPDPEKAPTNFKDFLAYMQGDFWTSVAAGNYADVYHPDSNWLVIADFKLLGIVEVGFIFYDSTPFYSLMLNVDKFFNFEITYTKVSDTIGMFYANLALPENLRTFQVGAASLTLPSIAVTVYTNGNWKLDVGFPAGDDWSRCFQVQAQAGPVPVTGAGGFYFASLSSATDNIFVNSYPSILAFGLAARLGVGKSFTSGPLSAGVSVTFFGIIEGAAGYLSSGASEIFQKPDALMLKGQFGLIGQIYGKLDFKIVTASLNVTLSASVGIQLMLESNVPGRDGSLLLYVEASVKVSVSVSINLGLFSISISFSFKASFRFQWEMTIGGGSDQHNALRAGYLALASFEDVSPLALCPGLNPKVTLWMLPELTVVFPNATGVGAPWFACSLGIEYDPQPPASPTPAQYKPFETITAQLATWALNQVGAANGCSGTVSIEQLTALDSDPTLPLVNWIDYDSLIGQLAVFKVTVSNANAPAGTQLNATAFPMFPFLNLQTKGRLKSTTPDELNYQFLSQNPVSQTYIEQLQEFFNQLYVNQTQGSSNQNLKAIPEDTTTPLVQEIFLDYFTGLIRGGVHQLLQTMQDLQAQQGTPLAPMALDQLIQTAIGGKYFASLAGQMSSSFRGGLRLPYAAGMTVPGGSPQTTDNPLYALLWQEFPVENTTKGQYTITLSNPDTTKPWVTSNASYVLTDTMLQPYQGITPSNLTEPSAPSQIPFTNSGPQAFSFQNAITWTQPQSAASSLRPFPSNLQQLQGATQSPVSVLVQSRKTGLPYLPGGTPLGTSDFTWATMITLNIKQVPGGQVQGSTPTMLKDVFALSGASQQDQQLLQQLLDVLKSADPISNIQVLYQTSASANGLNSDAVNAADVFALRTNTTTVSVPPAGPNMLLMAEAAPPVGVAVGAQIDNHHDFIQIIQQAAVTNAPGYYLRYLNTSGNSLPTALFPNGPAPITLLITYNADGSGNTPQSPAQVQPYYNAVVLDNATAGLLYYADTTDPALDTQYSAVAPGAVGVEMTRADSATLIQPSAAFAAAHGLTASQDYTLGQLITALQASGVNDPSQMLSLLDQAGAVPAQLNSLYSLITYRVEQSDGFIASNLSAPIQAQQPDDDNGNGNGGNTTHDYRVFVPLYNLAVDNQGTLSAPPDRYASINDAFAIDFYLNDAFGNQLTLPSGFNGTNLYFDPIKPVAEWLGVVTTFDFLVGTSAQANTFSVYLTPSATAFQQLSADQIASTLQLYYSIRDQINGPGVSFYVETNLALQQDGTMAQVTLPTSQSGQILQMVEAIITYLLTAQPNAPPSTPINVPTVTLTITLQQGAALPSLFDIAVLFGIQREPSLISPSLFEGGVLIYPPAQNVSSAVSPTVGSSNETGTAPVPLTEFAGYFIQAFSTLTLAVGLGGAQQAPTQLSSAARALAQARSRNESAALTSTSGSTSSTSGLQSLWAVQSVLLDISIGTGTQQPGPLYMSPQPLDNTLNTAVVPLPSLPSQIQPATPWPTEQLFSDVDLDLYNRTFFAAVDSFLAPESAAQAFEQARAAYTTITQGRESLAVQYGRHEVDWMFDKTAPFSGTQEQLDDGRETFEQQMRAALMTAYSMDTIVQYPVIWNQTVPPAADDMISLFGQIIPVGGDPVVIQNSKLSAAHVEVRAGGTPGLLTFLYGTPNIQNISDVTLDLVYNVTHVEYYLEPASQTPEDMARPSIWLQLVNPYPNGVPHVGPQGPGTNIPLVFRQYPTPPTILTQTGLGGTSSQGGGGDSSDPLVAAASWHFTYSYQSQITAHDRILSTVTYNTDLRVASSGGGGTQALDDVGTQVFSLFEALARFNATYPVLLPILTAPTNPNWATAAGIFADRVNEVVNNTDWNPPPNMALFTSTKPQQIDNNYIITDPPPQEPTDPRTITLMWDAAQQNVSDSISVLALAPNGIAYPNQQQGTVTDGVTNIYTPNPAIVDDWVVHQVEMDALNVLLTENALTGVQIQRNLIQLPATGTPNWTIQDKFVYKTPLVRPSQPVTPFIDSSEVIDVASLPNQGQSTTCPSSPSSLCQRIYTMMYDLIANPDHMTTLRALAAAANTGDDDSNGKRRVKVACGFQYPVSSAVANQPGVVPINPLIPIALARSFDVDIADPPQTDELNQFAAQYMQAIQRWSADNGIAFGPSATPAGACLVFDITLYAQLSGLNTPVLRLRNLQLKLTDVDPL